VCAWVDVLDEWQAAMRRNQMWDEPCTRSACASNIARRIQWQIFAAKTAFGMGLQQAHCALSMLKRCEKHQRAFGSQYTARRTGRRA
jgi:hypothetical protein